MDKLQDIQLLWSNNPTLSKDTIDSLDLKVGQPLLYIREAKEAIYFRNDVNDIIEFTPTYIIMEMVDEKLADFDVENIDEKIKSKVNEVVGGNGISVATVTNSSGQKIATVAGKIRNGEKIISVDASGFSTTLGMTISKDASDISTLKLTGIGGQVIAEAILPDSTDLLQFIEGSGISIVRSGSDVTIGTKIDNSTTNKLKATINGLYVSNIVDGGTF